jgi:hypothetical protein
MKMKSVRVKDIALFREIAKGYDCEVEEVKAQGTVRFKVIDGKTGAIRSVLYGKNYAYLEEDELTAKDGLFLSMDNDKNYSTLAARLGPGLGNLTRDYAVSAVKKGLLRTRHMVRNCTTTEEGVVIMRVAVNA